MPRCACAPARLDPAARRGWRQRRGRSRRRHQRQQQRRRRRRRQQQQYNSSWRKQQRRQHQHGSGGRRQRSSSSGGGGGGGGSRRGRQGRGDDRRRQRRGRGCRRRRPPGPRLRAFLAGHTATIHPLSTTTIVCCVGHRVTQCAATSLTRGAPRLRPTVRARDQLRPSRPAGRFAGLRSGPPLLARL